MAYSDYGGFAYRNGKKIEDRSDCKINPKTVIGRPGEWPGIHNIINKTDWPYHHVVLGDGPIFIGLHKQSYQSIYDLSKPLKDGQIEGIDIVSCLSRKEDEAISEYEGRQYINTDFFKETGKPILLAYKTNRIEIYLTHEDNYYQYCRLEQPDGTVWCAWSGYGVGAGLDDGSYGFSSEDRDEMLIEYWPDAIK